MKECHALIPSKSNTTDVGFSAKGDDIVLIITDRMYGIDAFSLKVNAAAHALDISSSDVYELLKKKETVKWGYENSN